MTFEEACLHLGISPDEELDIDEIDRAYSRKSRLYDPSKLYPDTPEFIEAKSKRSKIEEAYDVILEVCADLYEPLEEEHTDYVPHTLAKLAVWTAAVVCVSFAVFMYFIGTDTRSPVRDKNEAIAESDYMRDYERLLAEIEELKLRTETSPVQTSTTIPDYADLVEKVMPSIVSIETNTGRGSGFFVSTAGDVLTNYHVIEGAGRITVITSDGRRSNASVKDYDTRNDMALLKINAPSSTPMLTISPKLPRQGEAVIAIGNPRGFEGTVSNGIVSAFRENNTWVQFTAPVSEGSSGGALINLKGEVVGMPTKVRIDGQNLNFAIAPDVLAGFFAQAKFKAPRALTGSITRKSRAVSRETSPGLLFVRSDESYEVYLETENIDYDRRSRLASFITVWFPTERTNAQMKKDKNFKAIPGKDFGPCMLLYAVDFSDGTYLHLRTINLYTDGSVARDYVKPRRSYEWLEPKRNSRIESLINAVRRQLDI